MKKIFGIILIISMAISMAACGTKETKKQDNLPASKETDSNKDADGNKNADANMEDSSLQYIKDRGKLILGLDDTFPPMGFRDDADNIVGFDIDLAAAVCEKLGVELELQPISWTAKEQELNTKNIDCIWNGFSITPERLNNLTMSNPYMENRISLVVAKDSGITSFADMKGRSLALQSGSSAEETLNDPANQEFKDSLGTINGFDGYVTALMDLETGNSDAVLMDTVVASYMINTEGKDYVILDETLLADEYAVGFRKGEEALCKAVEDAFKELKEDGTINTIATKWFGSDITTIQ